MKDVREIFDRVINGEMSRADAEHWAYDLMQMAETEGLFFRPAADRDKLWLGIVYLNGVDLQEAPGIHLMTVEDIAEARERFTAP